jgi:hypothetical protein
MKNSNSRSLQYDLGENRLERAARIAEIERIQAKEYTPQGISKKEAEDLFSKYEPVNKSFITDFLEPSGPDKQIRKSKYGEKTREINFNVKFTKSIPGKLRGFLSVTKANIISDIREIFDNSQYAYSTNYVMTKPRPDGSLHKEKTNIEAYHHFVNKIIVDGETYYVRFIVEELTHEGQFHSAAISEVEIMHKKSRESSRSLPDNNLGGTVQPAYDESLAEFFDSVKGKVSKTVDENGEPKVVPQKSN